MVVVEKSGGVGGRVATRRLYDTCADHGVRYLEPQGKLSKQLIEILCDRGILQSWTDTFDHLEANQPNSKLCYVAPTGMSAIAKFLATGLEIWLNRRVHSITLSLLW